MNINRRNFLKLTTAAAFGSYINTKSTNFYNADLLSNNPNESLSENNILRNSNNEIIKPKPITENSLVAIAAPASRTSPAQIARCVKELKHLGCRVVIGDCVKNNDLSNKYFSAPDEERASEFMDFFTREDIDAIICARGGFGSIKILDLIDFEKIKNNPKILLGYSDITALLNIIHTRTGLVTFHGPLASSSFNEFQTKYFEKVLFFDDKKNKSKNRLNITYKDSKTLLSGRAEGFLAGGNLSTIITTLGTQYEIDTRDSILFLEETVEEPYKIDRMLSHLKVAGKFDSVRGIMFGIFKNLNTKRRFFPGPSFTVGEVLSKLAYELDIPVIVNMPFGHEKYNLTIPIGIRAELDTIKKTLAFAEDWLSY